MATSDVAEVRDPGKIVCVQRFQRPGCLGTGVAAHGVIKHVSVPTGCERHAQRHPPELPDERTLHAVPNHGRQVLP